MTTVDMPAVLCYLAANVDWLMHRPDAADALDELHAALDQLRDVVDTAPDLWYAGPCNVCGRDLYCKPEAAEVECRQCGLVYPMTDRRAWLLAHVDDQLARTVDVARALSGFGYDVTRHRIATWRDRGKIEPAGVDEQGRSLYRVGDVRDLLEADERKARPA
jgi:hypothetical protein